MPILHWLDREKHTKIAESVPYRLLEADDELSVGDLSTSNMVIQGDNLEALKSLLPFYAGRVKCIYIDPPYNTKSAFEHYDDNLEHSQWLAMMAPRLQLLWEFLSLDDGVILISINDDEGHYLKVLCDELFGRTKFIASLVWNYEGNTDNQAKIINYHEYILIYSKSGKIPNPRVIDPNISASSKLNKSEIRNTIVKNGPKNPPGDVVIPAGFPCTVESGVILKDSVSYPKYSDDIRITGYRTENTVTARTGWSSRAIFETFIASGCKPTTDSKGQITVFEMTRTGAIEAVKKRNQEKGHFVSVLRGFGTTNQMRLMLEKLGLGFTFPKPVNLIAYLLNAFTDDDSLVLDSFAGSGTTAHAVLNLNAMERTARRFILVEQEEETAQNTVVPRLRAVIHGSAEAEIPATSGSFRFYRLGPAIFDSEGQVSNRVEFAHLAAHVWFSETLTALQTPATTPLLGVHDGVGHYLLYNGILSDKSPGGGNVLTAKVLAALPPHDGPKVIYGAACRIGPSRLKELAITFKQTPYDVKAR